MLAKSSAAPMNDRSWTMVAEMLTAGLGSVKLEPAAEPMAPMTSAPIRAPARAATRAAHAIHGFQAGLSGRGGRSTPSGSSGATPKEGGGIEEGAVDMRARGAEYEAAGMSYVTNRSSREATTRTPSGTWAPLRATNTASRPAARAP